MNIHKLWSFASSIIRDGRTLIDARLKELELTGAEGGILLHLHLYGDAIMQDEIAMQLGISKPAVSKGLDSLEQKGFIVRNRDPVDRRINVVTLTEKAKAMAPRLKQVYDELYEAAAEGITQEEIAKLATLFGRIADNLSRRKEQLAEGTPKAAGFGT